METADILRELVNRLQASQGRILHIGGNELGEWPIHSVAALKSAQLLLKARPASRLICPGCEHQCNKPVELYPAEGAKPARAYVICDEPEDMGRIPVELGALEQWRVSSDASQENIAQALGISLPTAQADIPHSRQSDRDAAIRAKYAELAGLGKRNFVKEIKRTIPGADSLSDRRIRDIAKGR